ncbi:hypothetical protein [Rhodoplanes roseus]|uniref:Uncharacterized protein n=1 Tax=Rhodoplanes roseus TaxID=29409 RepID=A0A327L7S9_9BRAD|nr:hypothetical protein [Rhodoplanes roseus]RAI45953.1 hypothetical protein CH341_01170 [Rhodoplanes roseus]
MLSQAFIRRAPELERIDRLIAAKERTRQAGLNAFYRVREHYEIMSRLDEERGVAPLQLSAPSVGDAGVGVGADAAA